MKASVAMITYNHERYVGRAIECVLKQEADFDWELVIGEDCSTDGTRAICQEYQRRFPDRIRLLEHQGNVGMIRNFMQTLGKCRGSYVAICEGDDYWTEPHKLRAQTVLLDANPTIAICFHNVRIEWDGGGRTNELLCPPDQRRVSGLSDILTSNFIPTPSVMFRNRLFGSFPDWFATLELGDWPLHILNARHGGIEYIDQVMAVYRRHAGNTFARRDTLQNLRAMLHMYDCVSTHVSEASPSAIRRGRAEIYREMCLAYGYRSSLAQAMRFGLAAITLSPGRGRTYLDLVRAMKLAIAGA